MKCALKTCPKSVAHQKSALQIPLDDPEAAARYLVEIMPPAMRRDLGRLLCQRDWGDDKPDWADDKDML